MLRARKVPPGCLPVPLLTACGRRIPLYQQGFRIVGAGLWMGDIAHAQKSVPQMLEDFKQTPLFAR